MIRQRTFPPAMWLMMVVVLLAVVYGVGLFVFALRYPGDGAGGYLSGSGFTVEVARSGSVLAKGDVVVEINGRAVSDATFEPGSWHRFLFDEPASEASYVLDRDGQRVTLTVPWRSWRPLSLVFRVAPFSIVALSFFAALFLVLLSRSQDAVALLVSLAFCVNGINLANNMVTTLGANLALSLAWIFAPLDVLTFSLGAALALHVLLTFPIKKPLVTRWPRSIYAVYAVNLAIALANALWRGRVPLMQSRALIYATVLYPVAAIEFVVGLAHLVHTYSTTQRPGVRNQIRWLMWGAIIGVLPWLLLYNVPIALTGESVISLGLACIPLILIPLTFFFSVTRRGLLVVDTLINRSVIYASVTLLLITVFLLAVAIIEPVIVLLTGEQHTRLASIVAIIVVAMISPSLRKHFQLWVDRAFYRRWYDLKGLLRDVGQRLSMTLQLEALIPIVVHDIPKQLDCARASLLLMNEDSVLRAVDASGLALSLDDPFVAQLCSADTPLVISQFGNAESDMMQFDDRTWEIALPLRMAGTLSGIYLLGPRHSGDLFGQDEIETLVLLGQQIAVALENARLYREVERYSRDLESQVQARTRELQAANREQELERDRLNVILQNMADGLLVVSQSGRIVLANPALETMIRRKQVVGLQVGEVLQCRHVIAAIEQARCEPGVVLTADCVLEDRALRASSITPEDGAGTITVVRDVTHEVVLDRLKTEFISSVSHELRTPLTSVLGFTKLIHKSLERDVMPVVVTDRKAHRAVQRVLDNLDIVTVESERLARLVNDVLDVAKIESGRIEWNDVTFDLATVVQQAIDDVTVIAWQKGIVLNVDLDSRAITLRADPERIRQVLFSLLSNAVKFTDEGGITVETRFIETEEMASRWAYPPSAGYSGVLVSVKDTGLGIPKEEIPHLFRQFKQVREDSLINKPQGMGLGLAISRGIVSHYGGYIWVESEIGVGSTFQFVLPIATPAQPIEVNPSPVIIPGVNRRWQRDLDQTASTLPTVLVVDDEPNVRSLLVQELTANGYKVMEASNGIDALATARRYRPSAIVLDLMMPGLSGFDVIQLLKSDVATAAVPIVILSIIDDKEKGFIMGADAYLTKPIGMEVLIQTLADLVTPASEAQRAVVTDAGHSSMEQIIRTLREDGFQVVEAYDSRGAIVGGALPAPDRSRINAMLTEFDSAEAIKALRFLQKVHNSTIVVIERLGDDTGKAT